MKEADDDLRCWSCSQFFHHWVHYQILITHRNLVFFSLSVARSDPFQGFFDSEASPNGDVVRSSFPRLLLTSLLVSCSLSWLGLAPLLTHLRSVSFPNQKKSKPWPPPSENVKNMISYNSPRSQFKKKDVTKDIDHA